MAERSVEEMRADLAKSRAKMTGAIGDGKEAIRPQNIAKEGIEQVKTFARTEFDTATASLRDERGASAANSHLPEPRPAMTAGSLTATPIRHPRLQTVPIA